MSNPKTYALIVGIDQYKDLMSLSCATKDARDIAKVLRDAANRPHVKLLTNAAATKKAILQNLKWLADSVGSEDTAIVYLSGHGGRLASPGDDQSYFCPADALARNFEKTCITTATLTAALRAIKSERLIVLLDTCYSGGLGEARDGCGHLDAGLSSKDVSEMVEGRGRVILAASRPDERAFELREERNGLFTLYLLRALRGEVARPDGTIWVSDVFGYVSRVLREHKGQHAFQKSHGEDFVMLVQPAPVPARHLQSIGAVPAEFDQRKLRIEIIRAYSRAEIEVLSQDLGLSLDCLSDHRPLETQLMEFIDGLRRRNRIPELLDRLREDGRIAA